MKQITHLQDAILLKLNSVGLTILGTLAILIVGLIVANLVKKLFRKMFQAIRIDSILPESGTIKLSEILSTLIYYVLLVFVMMTVLNLLGVTEAFAPLKIMLNKFFGYVPNLIAAGLIGFIGYMISKIAAESTGFLAGKIDRFAEKAGLSNNIDLGKIVKQIVFIIVFIPILIVALDALKMTAISNPAKLMLEEIFAAVPNIIAASIILGVFLIGGKFIVSALKELLKGLRFDEYSEKIYLKPILGDTKITSIIGGLVYFFIAFAGIISALEKLYLLEITSILNDLLVVSGKIAFGLLIMIIGNFVANIAHKAVSKSENGALLASFARIVILGLFLSLGLNSMGIADDIVILAFGLTLGAVAVAFALSFGLGGKDAAGEQMKKLFEKLNKKD